MSSTFFGLNIARSGLFASQRALNVISHNVANADTKGYSRQRLDQSQYKPMNLGGDNGMLGTGVDTEAVKQIRDEFLDFKYREENTVLGEWSFRSEMFSMIESVFNEPSDSGIIESVNQFFTAVHELSKNPESLTTRALVRQRGIALTTNLGRMHDRLVETQEDINFQVKANVSQINGLAKEIASYNKTIYMAEIDGGIANDVRDQRNLAVDKLSKLVNVDHFEDDEGRFHVLVTGMPIVTHYTANEIVTKDRPLKLHQDDADELIDIEWATGATFNITGGQVKGILDMRDGDQEFKKGIPYYVEQLKNYTNRVFTELNRVQVEGYGLETDGTVPTGNMFFTVGGKSTAQFEADLKVNGLTEATPSSVGVIGAKPVAGLKSSIDAVIASFNGGTITAQEKDEQINTLIQQKMVEVNENAKQAFKIYNQNNPTNPKQFVSRTIMEFSDGEYYEMDCIATSKFTISKDIDEELGNIAASTTEEGVPGNPENALKMAEIRYNPSMFAWGSPDDFVNSLISNLGVDAQEAKNVVTNQKALVVEVENRRQSVMGVSLDEEMSEMIKFQHSYSANARVLTTMDEMLDLIVNRLGLVGR